MMSQGDFTIFVTRPIAAVILGIALLLLVLPLLARAVRERISTLEGGE